MSQAVDDPPNARARPPDSADRLRRTMAAARVSFTWFGTSKVLTPDQRSEAASAFGADGHSLSASKRLLDTRHPRFRDVTAIRTRIQSFWKGISLPFPETGVRLIRQDHIERFDVQMADFQEDLRQAVEALQAHFEALKEQARNNLARLFDPSDYPESLVPLFGVEWDYPSIQVPEYLRQLNPELFERESQRVAARFEEAVQLAEEGFIAELSKLTSHLAERLTAGEDGGAKTFRDSSVENLRTFFERFRSLNVRSNQQLDDLVEQCQRIVQGIEPQALRDNPSLRRQVATELSAVESVVDGLLVDRPRRRVLRPGR